MPSAGEDAASGILAPVRRGRVAAEGDERDARQRPLAADPARAGAQSGARPAAERRHDEVGRRVERHAERAQRQELQRDGAALGLGELRQEGQEEERGLRVEQLGHDALAEGAAAVGARRLGVRPAQAEQRADAQEDEVAGARVADDLEGGGRGHEQRREPERGADDVAQPAQAGPQRRAHATRVPSPRLRAST